MALEIVKAKYVGDYNIKLWFNNRETKVVDFWGTLDDEKFQPLQDEEYFKLFTIKPNMIEWPNGVYFAPEYLYNLMNDAEYITKEELLAGIDAGLKDVKAGRTTSVEELLNKL